MDDLYDLLIIGGGINGTAVARDAAGRGLKILLCERDDLAEHTSSSSTKLIHGGLRYLEYYEFRLVREALKEREVLLRAAPHIIWPMRFVLPHDAGLRPKWMLRAGLFLYDNLGGREMLPGTRTVDLREPPHASVLEERLTKGFEYSDCWVEDARLVVLNAVDAAARGAEVLTHTEVVSLTPSDEGFRAGLRSEDGAEREVRARGIVNSAGPWVDEVLGRIQRGRNETGLRLVKGSHIVTKRLFQGEHAYIFQNADNRVIFAIPYERDYTLIGTTDVPYTAAEGKPEASDEEIAYLCEAASEYLATDITPADVVWTYSGVRPLYDDKSEDASAVTRDYVLDIDEYGGRPVLSVYGGKITTSRKLGEHAVDKIEPYYQGLVGPAWTRDAALPGGNIEDADFEAFVEERTRRYPDIPRSTLLRICRAYGTEADSILADGGGAVLPGGLLKAEVRHLIENEWVREPEDVLWRRTKMGLHMSKPERMAFAREFARIRA